MKQYSLTVPLTSKEYEKGVKFVDYLIDFDLSKQTQQRVEIISQTPFIKQYCLCTHLPLLFQSLTQAKQLQLQERKTRTENGESRIFNVVQFPGSEIVISAQITQGDKPIYDVLDVINEQLDYFKGYEKDIARKLLDNFGIHDSSWKKYCANLVTVNGILICKLVTVEIRINYGEETSIIEQFLVDQSKKYIIYFYKSMILTYKNWNQLEDSELFQMNKQIFINQQSTSFRLNLFPFSIYNYQDLISRTKYLELKKSYLQNYQKSQLFSTPVKLVQSTSASPVQQFSSSLHRSREQQFVKSNLMKKKAGLIYKRGDGPIDYGWNSRYLILDGETLIYFKDKLDKAPRGMINLRESYISPVQRLEDRDHAFYIETQGKQFYFSGDNTEETDIWRDEISQATVANTPASVLSEKRKSVLTFSTNTYLMTETPPQPLMKYSMLQRLDELQNEWHFRKFRNGVKIYEKPMPLKKSQNKMLNYLYYLLPLLLTFIFGFYLDYLKLFTTFGIIISTVLFLQKKSTVQTQQVYARLVFDIDPQKAFNIIKSLKHKKILDPNIIQIAKKQKQDDIEFTKLAVATFNVPQQKSKSSKPKTLSLNVLRYRFIIKDGHSYIVDISTCDKLEIFEIYQIQRMPKISGKGIINYYCEITSKQNLQYYDKYLFNKAKNLSVISSNLDESRFRQFQQSIVNEIQSNKNSIILESTQVKGYEDQIDLIKQLKRNTCKAKGKKLEERKPGYRRFKEGGVECFNREEIKAQDGLVLDLIRSAGKQLFEGRNIISVSLPVRIFEPRSMIERIIDWWGFIPIYLELACQTQDQCERFRLVVTMVLAGLYNGARQKKPFNPILGETYQGNWQDGTQIFIEHTSHHPPISHFYIVDQRNRYKYYGHYEYQAALRPNAVIGNQVGDSVIQFKEGQKIVFNMPGARVSGLVYGARVQDWYNTITFTDQANGFKCEIKFSEGAGLLIGRNAKPTDCFEGTLTQNNKIISKIEGSWLESILWDNNKYWDLEVIDPAILIKTDTPLPSDCRFRTDLNELARGDLDRAQEEKNRLEVLQRRDRKLRHDRKLATK